MHTSLMTMTVQYIQSKWLAYIGAKCISMISELLYLAWRYTILCFFGSFDYL